METIAPKAIRNEGWPRPILDRWAATRFETSRNQRTVYEQHPVLADCSSARFVPDGFEVFTPGD